MSMLPKGKSRVAAILLRMKEERDRKGYDTDDKDDRDDRPSKGSDHGLVSAMEDFLKAKDDNDAEAMAKALCDFLHIHEGCDEEG